jgi:hypothetical protein
MKSYENPLRPIRVGNMELKNRMTFGVRPNREIARSFEGSAPDVIMIGDRNSKQITLWNATRTAFDSAMSILWDSASSNKVLLLDRVEGGSDYAELAASGRNDDKGGHRGEQG